MTPTLTITRDQLIAALWAEWDSCYVGPDELAVNIWHRLTTDQDPTEPL